MPGLYSEELKRHVREANNIVDVIQSAVGKLTRAGRNLKACCPFHNEKTPSFNVNPEGQYFNCFGCGKKGDVFTFIMLHERVEFPEAFKILADRAGIRVETDPKAAETYTKEKDWKSYLYKLNGIAAKFFREQLFADSGKAAREYVKKRGLADEICEEFAIGYAPANGSPLVSRLQTMGAPLKAIVAAGLATQRDDGSIRDFFYDRLMFPICDIQSRIIAFGGRILGEGEPKYLNTRETPLFSKTRTVYAIDHAKNWILSARKAVLVEGYTDVMMCHQFGVKNVVACLGTAITAEHVRQLRRVADQLLLLTDSDAAGAKASERSLGVLFQEEMPSQVARLPGNDKDPCDFLLAHGKEPFVAAVEKAVDLFEYKFEMVQRSHDLLNPMGLKNAAEDLMSMISLIPDTLLKNNYRYEVLKRLNVNERDLQYDRAPKPAATEGAGAHEVVPPPENELARSERELLRFLVHQPNSLWDAEAQKMLAGLSGKPEHAIGKAMLDAMADGELPPDSEVIEGGNAGSITARAILKRLQSASDSDETPTAPGAVEVCIDLAESISTGKKLDSGSKLGMLLRPVRQAILYRQHDEANRRLTHARLNGDKISEENAYAEVVSLRKEIAILKSDRERSYK